MEVLTLGLLWSSTLSLSQNLYYELSFQLLKYSGSLKNPGHKELRQMKSLEVQIYCIEQHKQFVNKFFDFFGGGIGQSLIIYPSLASN